MTRCRRDYVDLDDVTDIIYKKDQLNEEIKLTFEKKDSSLRYIRCKMHDEQSQAYGLNHIQENCYIIMEDLDLKELRLVNIAKVTSIHENSFEL